MTCYSPLKGWCDKATGGIRFDRTNSTGTMDVACGQCIGCRLDRSRMWAMRIIHESSLYSDNCFITLTYRNESEANEKQASGFFLCLLIGVCIGLILSTL